MARKDTHRSKWLRLQYFSALFAPFLLSASLGDEVKPNQKRRAYSSMRHVPHDVCRPGIDDHMPCNVIESEGNCPDRRATCCDGECVCDSLPSACSARRLAATGTVGRRGLAGAGYNTYDEGGSIPHLNKCFKSCSSECMFAYCKSQGCKRECIDGCYQLCSPSPDRPQS